MRRYRAPVDPHVDPLRAPSARGQHPHTLRSQDEVHNPQMMYERRLGPGVMYGPMQQRGPLGAAPQQQQGGGFFDHPLVLFGLGAVAIAGAAYLMRQSEGRELARDALLDEMLVRQNPAPASSVVVVAPPGVPVTASNAPAPMMALPAPSQDPLAVAAAALDGRADLSAVIEKKPKKKRTRRTTQARGKDGTFKKAGTRKKPIVEGKKT